MSPKLDLRPVVKGHFANVVYGRPLTLFYIRISVDGKGFQRQRTLYRQTSISNPSKVFHPTHPIQVENGAAIMSLISSSSTDKSHSLTRLLHDTTQLEDLKRHL